MSSAAAADTDPATDDDDPTAAAAVEAEEVEIWPSYHADRVANWVGWAAVSGSEDGTEDSPAEEDPGGGTPDTSEGDALSITTIGKCGSDSPLPSHFSSNHKISGHELRRHFFSPFFFWSNDSEIISGGVLTLSWLTEFWS